jgi:hypothetical protein
VNGLLWLSIFLVGGMIGFICTSGLYYWRAARRLRRLLRESEEYSRLGLKVGYVKVKGK